MRHVEFSLPSLYHSFPSIKKKTNNPSLHRQQMGGQQRFNQFLKILCCANIFVYGS